MAKDTLGDLLLFYSAKQQKMITLMAKDTLGDLLLFYSAKQQKMITLDEYLAAAPAGAESIFYAAGDSLERLAATSSTPRATRWSAWPPCRS